MKPVKSFIYNQKQNLVILGLILAAALIVGVLIFRADALVILALGLSAAGFLAMIFKPDFATMVVMFLIYTNISVIAYQFHGVPQIVVGSISLLICVPFAVYVFIRRQSVKIDYTILLMLLYFVSLLLSFFVAKDKEIAFDWVFNYLFEGLLLYFLIINVVRRAEVLRGVIWSLIIAGGLLGGLTLYQEVTKSYDNNFGGLIQRNLELGLDENLTEGSGLIRDRHKVQTAHRAGGPIGDPNRFAQILVAILPLAFFRIMDEKNTSMKMFAIGGVVLILSGILLTYSRGGFLTICIIVMCMTLMRYIQIHKVIFSLLGLALVVAVAAPGYFTRMDSIKGITGLFSEAATAQSDAVILGRTTEMLAAFHVFLDYPIVGVGPGQYGKYYSLDYMSNPDIAFRRMDKSRRAHSLYLELAAETGILGIGSFLIVAAWMLYGLWQSRRRWQNVVPEYANFAAAFFLGIIGYLTTAIFLSLAYQRYYWVIMALAGATIHILKSAQPPGEENTGDNQGEWQNADDQPMNFQGGELSWQRKPSM